MNCGRKCSTLIRRGRGTSPVVVIVKEYPEDGCGNEINMEKKNTWETYSSKQLKELEKINAQYRDFLDNGKTERECIDTIVNTIEKSGYRELESLIKEGTALKTGDKVYSVWMNKSIAMFQIGRKPMTEGMNILGAHIDSPRLDVKQNPLYEDGGFAYLDTHYYGGVKKYQWVTFPWQSMV